MLLRYTRPVSHSARAARKLAGFSLLLFLAVLAAHRFAVIDTPSATALAIGATGLSALSVLLALRGLWRLWSIGAEGGVSAGVALLYALLPLGLLAFATWLALTRPPLYDISTDIYDVPPWLSAPNADPVWMKRPAEITPDARAAQFFAYPGLSGRRYDGALDRIYQAVVKVAEAERIRITATSGADRTEPDLEDMPLARPDLKSAEAPAEGPVAPDVGPVPQPRPDPNPSVIAIGPPGDVLLQGETRSFLLGLSFDVMIRLREETETTLVDVRVASRYGDRDLGFSAAVGDHFLRALDAELLGIAGD